MESLTLQDVKGLTQKTYDTDPCDSVANSAMQHLYDMMSRRVSFEASPEDVIMFMGQIDVFVEAAKQLKSDMKQAVVEWIEHNGDLEVDADTRYYAGNEKRTKCLDLKSVGLALLDSLDGDLNAVFDFIKSEGWKHGLVKKQLGQEKYSQLYSEEDKLVLKTGKPKKTLKLTNKFSQPKTQKGKSQ